MPELSETGYGHHIHSRRRFEILGYVSGSFGRPMRLLVRYCGPPFELVTLPMGLVGLERRLEDDGEIKGGPEVHGGEGGPNDTEETSAGTEGW